MSQYRITVIYYEIVSHFSFSMTNTNSECKRYRFLTVVGKHVPHYNLKHTYKNYEHVPTISSPKEPTMRQEESFLTDQASVALKILATSRHYRDTESRGYCLNSELSGTDEKDGSDSTVLDSFCEAVGSQSDFKMTNLDINHLQRISLTVSEVSCDHFRKERCQSETHKPMKTKLLCV